MTIHMGNSEDISISISDRVHDCYWVDDVNCATAMLRILGELHSIHISEDIYNAAIGMHGAGGYGAQCGLVEGALMFIGIACKTRNFRNDEVTELCKRFAAGFEEHFGSLECRVLRPQGFSPENPPHLCEKLTVRGIEYANRFSTEVLGSAGSV